MKFYKYIPLYLLAVFIAVYINVELAYGFIFAGALGLIQILLFFLGFGFIWLSNFKKRKMFFYNGFCIIGSLVVIGILSSYVIDLKKKASMEKAIVIINALEHYKQTKGFYPNEIDEVETINDKDMKSKMGIILDHKYMYHKYDDSEEFSLNFSMPAWLIATYSSKTKTWIIDD